MKRILPIALAGLALMSISSCKNGGSFQKKDGLEYKLVVDKPGQTAKVGDFVEINIRMLAGNSVMADSRKLNGGKPLEMPIQPSQFRGEWTQGLTLMSPGDSAVFRMSVDTLKKMLNGQQLPPFMKPGTYIYYQVSMVAIKSQEDYKKEMDGKAMQQKDVDDKLLQDYLAKNNIKATKTASGMYYTVQAEGKGDMVKLGDTVSINYVGKTMDGKVFDSNTDPSKGHMKPLTFAAGMHQMIPGMDEGVMMLKKGGKATLYIPSGLGYAERSPGPGVPANSILIFDVDVTDVKH